VQSPFQKPKVGARFSYFYHIDNNGFIEIAPGGRFASKIDVCKCLPPFCGTLPDSGLT
jgi:hypothetical protein